MTRYKAVKSRDLKVGHVKQHLTAAFSGMRLNANATLFQDICLGQVILALLPIDADRDS
jgi:hypothetical protein